MSTEARRQLLHCLTETLRFELRLCPIKIHNAGMHICELSYGTHQACAMCSNENLKVKRITHIDNKISKSDLQIRVKMRIRLIEKQDPHLLVLDLPDCPNS